MLVFKYKKKKIGNKNDCCLVLEQNKIETHKRLKRTLQTHERLNRTLFIRTKHNIRVNPLYQGKLTALKQQLNGEN